MHWGRAKAILTIAFLLLDAALAYRLWSAGLGAGGALAALPVAGEAGRTGTRDAAALAEMLAARGVRLEAPLPRVPAALPLLTVRIAPPDGGALAAALFRDTPGVERQEWPGDPGGVTFRAGDEALTVLPQGLVIYERRGVGVAPEPPSATAARAVADAFVERLGGLPPDGAYDYTAPAARSPGQEVRYVQRYGDVPVFGGYLAVEVAAQGVVAAKRVWLEPMGRRRDGRPVLPPGDALLAWSVQATPPTGAAVVEVRLGYYSQNYLYARQWDMVPAWRIRLNTGEVFYVNAYTGSLEQ
ncbi:MAG: two-component system regulatory protein YycI [Clostridia bacterium]|nr:two-component system regulatory protein YycI [Clostridia bacterium]